MKRKAGAWASLFFVICCSWLCYAEVEPTSGPAAKASFGHVLLPLFMLEKGYVNLNHGSFGATPRSVIEGEHRWEAQMELNPDRWFRGKVYEEVK